MPQNEAPTPPLAFHWWTVRDEKGATLYGAGPHSGTAIDLSVDNGGINGITSLLIAVLRGATPEEIQLAMAARGDQIIALTYKQLYEALEDAFTTGVDRSDFGYSAIERILRRIREGQMR